MKCIQLTNNIQIFLIQISMQILIISQSQSINSIINLYIVIQYNPFYYLHMKYSFLAFILLSLVCTIYCQLNPERLHAVDKNQKLNNYLVRGNLPISSDKKFQIKELKDNLTKITGLQDYQLIVVSFLNFLTAKQTKHRYIQEKFFENHPSSGEYRTKLILGSLIDPLNYPQIITQTLDYLSYYFDIDNIENFVSQLHEEIHHGGKNKIIFIHCSAGMDRTGLVAGAYKLKYLNYTMKKVIEENSKFGGARKFMHFNALNGLKWYCLSIKQTRQECLIQKK